MIAYFLNSRSDKHGKVNVRQREQDTLDKFVGGSFVRNQVKIGDVEYMVIAEGAGRVSAVRDDGIETLSGNLLIIAFASYFEDRDMEEEDIRTISDAIRKREVEGDTWNVLEYERGTV